MSRDQELIADALSELIAGGQSGSAATASSMRS